MKPIQSPPGQHGSSLCSRLLSQPRQQEAISTRPKGLFKNKYRPRATSTIDDLALILTKARRAEMGMKHHHHHQSCFMADIGSSDRSLQLPTTQVLLLLLFLLLLPPTSQAQQGSTAPSPTYGFSTRFNPTVAVVVVLLISAFFFAGFMFVYCRQRATQRHQGSLRRAAVLARSRRAAAVEDAARGLDPEVVKGFPTVVYADVKGHRLGDNADAPLECAVCLCEFDDEEALTLLPKCSHAFHPECIGEWLKSHTTCPVCRANLAADELETGEAGGEEAEACEPTAAEASIPGAVSSTASNQGESRPPRPDDHVVSIPVEVEEADEHPAELTRMGSSRKGVPQLPRKSLRTWRSRSARPTIGERVGQFWAEEERERFTLRLPEDVRKELMAGKLNRSASVTGAFPAGLRSSRRGYLGGEGSSRGGRSYRMGLGRWDRKAKSDRGWAALGRAVAGMGSRHGGSNRGGGEGEHAAAVAAAPSGDCSKDDTVKRAEEAAEEGPGTSRGTQVLAAVRDQFNCLIRGGSKHQQASSGKDDHEASSTALNKV